MFLRSLGFMLTIAACYGSVDIEKYLKVCNRNSPDVNDCLVDAVQAGIAMLAGGVPELGVPPLDPYFHKSLKFEYNNNQIQAKMTNKNIYVRGLTDSTVRDARLQIDDNRFHLEIDMFSNAISVDGQYKGSGSYNALTLVNAEGIYVTNMTDLVYTWKLDGKPEIINDELYVRITSFYMRPDVSSMNIYLTNEAPETKDLINLAVQLVNDNWRILYKELLPIAIKIWDEYGTKVANEIFLKVPLNRLFPN